MATFLLILRIILLVAFVAGLVVSMSSKAIAKAKKFGNQAVEDHYAVKTKLIGYIICGASVAVLLLLSFAN